MVIVHRNVICLLLISISFTKCNSYWYPQYDSSSEEETPENCHEHTHHHHPQVQRQYRTNQGTEKPVRHEPRSIDRSDANSFAKPERETVTQVYKVQEDERRRLESRAAETVNRTQGTYKIVNYPAGGIAKRRGTINVISLIPKIFMPTIEIHSANSSIEGNNTTDKEIKTEKTIRQADTSSSDFVFPGPDSRSSASLNLIPEVPEECIKQGICENVPNYPTEHVKRLLKKLGNETLKLKVDEMDLPEIAQRIGGSPDEETLCDEIERFSTPQAGPDKNGKWFYIVNQKDAPLQGFRLGICKNDGAPCSNDKVSFRPGYKATCKQKHVLRYLASIEPDGTLTQRHFKLPSCCHCIIENEY